MSKLLRMLRACVIVFLTNVYLNWKFNIDNFKFNFPSQGQFESLNLDKFLILNYIQNITMPRGFFGNLTGLELHA